MCHRHDEYWVVTIVRPKTVRICICVGSRNHGDAAWSIVACCTTVDTWGILQHPFRCRITGLEDGFGIGDSWDRDDRCVIDHPLFLFLSHPLSVGVASGRVEDVFNVHFELLDDCSSLRRFCCYLRFVGKFVGEGP